MTASTKPIRPELVLRSNRPRVVVDQVFEQWLGRGDRGLPRGRRLAHDLVGILAVRQPGDADVLELDARRVPLELTDEPDEGGHPGAAGLLARRVDVVGEDDPRRIAREQSDLAGRERGPEAGHDVVEARLVRHQGVRVALDDDRLARLADGTLGLVDEIQRAALVEQRRRRGVEVLRSVTLEQPAAEPHGVAVLVADREQDPGPELVVHAAAAALARGRQADFDELVRPDVALGAQRPGQLVPATGRPAELVRLDRRVREAASVEVVEGGLAGVRGHEHGVVEGDRAVEDPAQARSMGILVLGALVDLDARALGEGSERLREGHAIALHHEAEDVASKAAAEAMPALARWRDDERRCLLAVERAEPLVGAPCLLQADRFADDLDDRQLVLHFGCDTDRQIAPPGPEHGCGPVKS